MAIEKRQTKSGVRYKAVFRRGKIRRSKTFSKKIDAQRWEALQESEQAKLEILGIEKERKEKESILFDEYAVKFLAKCEVRVTPGTLTEYKSKIEKKFIPFFENRRMKEISTEDIEDLIVFIRKEYKLGPVTLNMYITLIKQIFDGALKTEYITKDPSKSIKLIKTDEREFSYWDIDEINHFKSKATDWEFYDFVLIALNTGMRIGELSALRPMDINFSQNIIRVTRTIKKNFDFGSTKGKTNRSIPITNNARLILKRRVEALNKEDLIFKNKGKPINTSHFSDRHWRPLQYRIKCKSPIRFHDLRHTFASHFMMNNGNIFTLQKILGHSDIKETMKYAHLSPSHLQDAVGIINF